MKPEEYAKKKKKRQKRESDHKHAFLVIKNVTAEMKNSTE